MIPKWVDITPLGAPVVPLENCIIQREFAPPDSMTSFQVSMPGWVRSDITMRRLSSGRARQSSFPGAEDSASGQS